MTIQSSTIEGYSVTMWPGVCHVSKGYFHSTLGMLQRDPVLLDKELKALKVSAHAIQMIMNWATARGYTKERTRAVTPISKAVDNAIDRRQLALPLETPRPRRQANR